jgi:hypothetical protein
VAYVSLAVICAASIVIGQAILILCGGRGFTWLSGPVGLAALLMASGIAIKLPGHAIAVAIALAALVLISLAVVLGSAPLGRPGRTLGIPGSQIPRNPSPHVLRARRGVPVLALVAAAIAIAAGSIPFAVNGHVGILGVGLVNDDMASHLLIADWLNTRVGETPALIHQGYPVGPQALVAGISRGLGPGLVDAFAGLTLAIPPLTALVAFECLNGLNRGARLVAAALVCVPYLAAAYLAQEAFKEPIEALFLLSFALLLPTVTDARRAIPLGLIAAGAVYTYSFPGLFWLVGTAVVYVGVVRFKRGAPGGDPENMRSGIAGTVRGRDAERSPGGNRAIPAVVACLALLVLIAPDLARVIDFTHFRAFRTSTISSGLGNLRHQISPLEALGIWPASDFRLSASAATAPAAAFYMGALVAAVALALALPRWLRRYGSAVPAALAAAIVIYLGARLFGTVYTSAKALAIAAPLVPLITFGGLLEREGAGLGREQERATPGGRRRTSAAWTRGRGPAGTHPAALLRSSLALAVGLGIAFSSFLVLRQAPVAPSDHADQLAALRPLVQGHDVLFLGRDNFIAYELRGARPFTAVRNFYDPNYVKPNLRLKDVFRKFDFDSVTPKTLARFPFVITTRAAYSSGPPPAYRPVRKTPDFVLWRRLGGVGLRRTLREGANPGAILRCPSTLTRGATGAAGRATVFAATPIVGGRWSPSPTVEDGSPATQALTLPAGRWEASIQYDATRPLVVSAPGMRSTLPANLDYRGSVPYYAVAKLRVRHRGPVRFTVSVERPPLLGRLLGTTSEAHLGAIALSPAGSGGPIPGEAERQIPLHRACGDYLDWYLPHRGP